MSSFKKLQKLFAVLLVFTFMAGLVTVPNAAYAAKREPLRNLDIDVKKLISDIEDESVKDAVLRLNAFGIIEGMEDGKYHPETKLTREQFAKILVTSLKMDHAAQAGVGYKSFPDVPADRWSAGFVGVAAGQGLIQGYPDGTFKPTKEVSYAEAVTMLVRALGYKDQFLPGAWPGNYLAKAAEKDITKKVKFSDASGIVDRGDAALMVNNTLDAKVVKVDQYEGQVVKHYESEKTLLEDRLDITKAEDARMVATKRLDDGLKWEEVKVHFTKDVKDPADYDRGRSERLKFKEGETKDLDFVEGFNPEGLIGEEVTLYLNDDDEVVYAESEYDDKAYFDYIEKLKGDDKDRLDLVRFDDDYPFAKDAFVFMKDGDKVKEIDVDNLDYDDLPGKFGKIVVNNNKIVWAEIMESGEVPPWFIVMKNDDGFLTGISETNEEAEVDLRKDEDYDDIIVLDINGEELEVKDIEKGDLIYVQKQELDSDDYAYVRVVKDNIKEGTLGKVKHDRIEIGDKEIKVVKYKVDRQEYDAYYSVDDGDEIKLYDLENDTEVEDDMEDADGEDIVAYLDAVGRIAYFQTATSTTSGYKYGVVTRVYMDKDRLKIFTIDEDGEDDEITYTVEEEDNIDYARVLDEYGMTKDSYDKDKKYNEDYFQPIKKGSVVKFKLNKDGEIAEDKLYVHKPENLWVINSDEDFGKDYLPKAYLLKKHTTSEGEENYGKSGLTIDYDALKDVDTKSYAFSVKDDAVIIDAETYTFGAGGKDDTDVKFGDKYAILGDTGDFGAAKWKDLKEANGIDCLFYVFADDNRKTNAKAAVFIGQGSGAASDDEIGIYVINTWLKGGDRYVKYHEYDGEVEERELDNEDIFFKASHKEHPYVAKVKSNGKLDIIQSLDKGSSDDFEVLAGVITKKDSKTIEVKVKDDVKTYSISNKTVVYDEDDKKTTSSLRKDHKIEFVVEKGNNVRVVGIVDEIKDTTDSGDDDEDEVTGVVTYISAAAGDGSNLVIEVTDKDGNFREYARKDGEISIAVANFLEANRTALNGAGMTFNFDKNGNINGVKAIKLGTASGNLTIDAITGLNGVVIDGVKLTGNLTVNADKVTVKNLEVTGNVTVGTGVTEFTAEGTNFDGETILNGGGEDSVHFNNAKVKKLTANVKVRVVLDSKAKVEELVAMAAVKVEGAKNVDKLDVQAEGVEVDALPEVVEGLDNYAIELDGEEFDQEDLDAIEEANALEAAEAAVVAAEKAPVATKSNRAAASVLIDEAQELINKLEEDSEDREALQDRLNVVKGKFEAASVSRYGFEVAFGDVVAGENVNVEDFSVTLKATDIREKGYEAALILVDIVDEDGNKVEQGVTIEAKDTAGKTYNVANVGYWGPPNGFSISKDYDVKTTAETVKFENAGKYTITFTLIDKANEEDKVIVKKAVELTVKAADKED